MLHNLSIIRDQGKIIDFLKNYKKGTAQNLANCCTAVSDDRDLPRFQTIREFYAGYPGIVYNREVIFIAGYVFDAQTYADEVQSKSLYQFHEEYQRHAKGFRRWEEENDKFTFFSQTYSLSMYSTQQGFENKFNEYLSRQPMASFNLDKFYKRKPSNPSDPINYSSSGYLDKDGNEIKIPAIAWTFNHKYANSEKYNSVKHNEVHVLAHIANVADVFIHADDLEPGHEFYPRINSLFEAFKFKKTLNDERQKLLAYLENSDPSKSINRDFEEQRQTLQNCYAVEEERGKILLEKYSYKKINLAILEFIKKQYDSGNFEPMSEEMKSAFFNKGLKTDDKFDPENPENKKRWVDNQIKKITEELGFIDSDIETYKRKYAGLSSKLDFFVRSADSRINIIRSRIEQQSDKLENFKKDTDKFTDNFRFEINQHIKITDLNDKKIIDQDIARQLQKQVEIKVYSPDPKIEFLGSLEDHQFDLTKKEFIALLQVSITENNLDLFKFCLNFKAKGSSIGVLDDIIKSTESDSNIKKLKEDLSTAISSIAKLGDKKNKEIFYGALTAINQELIDDEDYKKFLEKKFTFCLDALESSPQEQEFFLKTHKISSDLAHAISHKTELSVERIAEIEKGRRVFEEMTRGFATQPADRRPSTNSSSSQTSPLQVSNRATRSIN